MKLFVKTWQNDLSWLKNAIISCEKCCEDSLDWYVVVDDGGKLDMQKVVVQVEQFLTRSIQCKIMETSAMWPEALHIQNGYLRQQWIKMNAHKFIGDEMFWFWDSDLIAQKKFSSKDLLGGSGRPIYWFTQFNALMGGADDNAHHARKAMIRDIYGLPDISFEWMRCFPICGIGGILRHASSTSYWQKALQMLVASDSRFSEFNVIGQFCHLYFPDAFEWKNTHSYPDETFSGSLGDPKRIVFQGYSWGGMPEDVTKFVEKL